MPNNITKVAVIGTGVIGAGWIIRMLAHNKKVTAFDKDTKLKKKLNYKHTLNQIGLNINSKIFKEDFSQIKTYLFKKK